jgi:hypothetical protein
MAHNLLRAAGALASLPYAKARAATIRRDLIAIAARTARHGRGHITLHLPRRLAPRAGMAEPPRHLRAARRSGLTSPELVTQPPRRKAAQIQDPEPGTPDTPQNRSAAGKPTPR